MELKEGMYVRYTRGAINGYVPPRIARIVDCSDNELIKIDTGQIILRSDVIEASYNPIDLIEVGDYVNGLRVEKNKYGELYTSYVYYGGDIGKMCEVYTTWLKEYKKDKIYSIVTKEQFETMKYIIEK